MISHLKTHRLRVTILLGFVLSFLLLGSAGYFSFLQIDRLTETQHWVSRTHEVRKELYELLVSLNDAGSGQRGYEMTGDESYLLLNKTGVGKTRQTLDLLQRELVDNPDQERVLESLRSLIQARLVQINERFKMGTTVAIGSPEDRALVLKTKALMDRIRKLREDMDLHEAMVLIIRENDARDATKLTKIIAGIGSALGFILLALTFHQIWKENVARQRTEKALKESGKWLQTITDNVPALIGYVDTGERFRFANRAYEGWHGYTPEQMLGLPLREFMGGETYADLKPYVDMCLGGKRVVFEREIAQLKTGRHAQVTYIPHFDDKLEVIGYFILAIDITERKKAEADTLAARKSAEAASRAKSEFLANMSHEIRTPMNGILGMADLMARSPLSEQQHRQISMIKTSANTLLEIVDGILDVFKIEAGKMELDSQPFSLREGFETVMAIMSAHAHLKKIELVCQVLPDVPDNLVGDSTRLNQIVTNLVGNAVKFTDNGEVYVRVACESRHERDVCLHVSVNDSGIGIPEEKQQLIFDAFTQADSSTTRRFGGTGLGLTICKEIVTMLRGRIWVQSTVGQGSTFHFTAHFGLVQEPLAGRLPTAPMDFTGHSVLVVDDNETNRIVLEEILAGWKMKPSLAPGGPAAIDLLERAKQLNKPFSVVLVDAEMPDEDGFTLASRIKEARLLTGAPVVMLSGGDAERCRKMGVPYIVKPIGQSNLMDSLVTALNGLASKASFPADFTSIPKHPGRALHVLLAEDNTVNQAVAVGILDSMGHSTTVAGNGRDAVALYQKEHFDLVLMDIQMPEMDGFEATSKILSQHKGDGRAAPVIAMTAHAMKGDRERCISAGMSDYISKPVTARDILRVMMRLNLVRLDNLDINENRPANPPEPTPPTTARFDRNTLIGNFKDSMELLKSIAGLFIDHAPKWMADIQEAISEKNAKKLRSSAHALKGSVSNFVQTGPCELAFELEQKGRANDLAGAETVFANLRSEINALCATLEEVRRES